MERRQAKANMLLLNDHLLKDIGLDREDVTYNNF